MVPYPEKQGVILYGINQICIRCDSTPKKGVMYRKSGGGQNAYMNYDEDEVGKMNRESVSSSTIIFNEQVL
jgi:hypothetical protein